MEQKKEGKVWLVGAGPSDAELLTLKAKRVLEQAEVVVYDRLVGESILLMIPETAEKSMQENGPAIIPCRRNR